MSTAPPDLPSNLNLKKPEQITAKIRTITPMFGGSATAREVDKNNPVRAASVRGHLRFWWRATAGASYQESRELYEAESAIWGRLPKLTDGGSDKEAHGKVRVEVRICNEGQECQPVRHEVRGNGNMAVSFDKNALAYALFPFQGTIKHGQTEEAPAKALKKITFEVVLTCPPECRQQVETALHAWVLFGGIGSRTRRGCGSLAFVDQSANMPQPKAKSQKLLTTLAASYFVGQANKDPEVAWSEAVKRYRDFRQGERFARNEGKEPNRPGRSRYPEPDTLRRITRQCASNHEPTHQVCGFPRADLGLPIIFHFQGKGDPSDQTLQGKNEGQQRFASPVITKVAKIDDQYLPLIMLLDSPHVWEGPPLELKNQREVKATEINLPKSDLANIMPLQGLPIREAFKKYIQEEGFSEVKL